MIVPNLMVSDMVRSVRFYRDILRMTLTMTVSPEREVGWPGDESDAAFAVLEWDGAQLMLQTVESLAGELAVFAPDHAPAPSGTIYFRGLHPGSVRDRVAAEDIVKGPERSWYGMMELYVRDPDGYVICLGAPEGAPGNQATLSPASLRGRHPLIADPEGGAGSGAAPEPEAAGIPPAIGQRGAAARRGGRSRSVLRRGVDAGGGRGSGLHERRHRE